MIVVKPQVYPIGHIVIEWEDNRKKISPKDMTVEDMWHMFELVTALRNTQYQFDIQKHIDDYNLSPFLEDV